MVVLSKHDLEELDKKLDASIEGQGLLSCPRDIALVHLLRYFEDYGKLYVPMMASGTMSNFKPAIKAGQDAMHFAILWIFKFCQDSFVVKGLNTKGDVYAQAKELHKIADSYSRIWDFMAELWRDRAIAEQDFDGTIHVRYVNQVRPDVDTAGHFISSPDSPDLIMNLPQFSPEDVKVEIQAYGQKRFKYRIPNNTFHMVTEYLSQILSHLWELDESWDFGGYSVAEFRKFYVALSTLCWIHKVACFKSGIRGGALNNVVKILKRKRWENEIAKWGGLSKEVVSTILDDLIYDVTLYRLGKRQPDVTCQPFFPLSSDLLALSNELVILSNAERNMWSLLSVKRETIHATLRNLKEKHWLEQLIPQIQSYGLKTFGPISFTHNQKKSDLDLLILDYKKKFGVGCQLKWLTHPDRIKEIVYADEELQKGLKQAELSLQWLNSKPYQLSQLTGLSANDLTEYEFKIIVLSKNTIGSAWIGEPNIPIVNERLIHWILGVPHRKDLWTLWKVAEELRYCPKRGKHFVDKDAEVEFEGVRFVGENTDMVFKESWEPDKDIDLAGLT